MVKEIWTARLSKDGRGHVMLEQACAAYSTVLDIQVKVLSSDSLPVAETKKSAAKLYQEQESL